MSLLNPQRLSSEEFPEQQGWIEKLLTPLNLFTGEVVQAFQNKLTISDNLFQEIKEVKFVNTSTNFPLKIKTKFNLYPKGLTYIYLQNNTLGSYSLLAPHIVWTWADKQLSISNISGLTAASTYTIRLHLIYG